MEMLKMADKATINLVNALKNGSYKPSMQTKAKKYRGYHVAYANINSNTVVAYGKNPAEVLRKARKRGYPDASLAYVPEENEIFMY